MSTLTSKITVRFCSPTSMKNLRPDLNFTLRFLIKRFFYYYGYSIKRHSCAIHRLQTTVQAFEKDVQLNPVLQKARRIVRTSRKSNVATEELLKVTELTLVANVSTRWNSTLLLLKRLELLEVPVQDIMSKFLKIPSLTPGEWVIIKFIIKLLDKFSTVSDGLFIFVQ